LAQIKVRRNHRDSVSRGANPGVRGIQRVTAPDLLGFVFFRGMNDVGDGKGLLRAQVTGGLRDGVYRACTMIVARNHQPLLMPIA